MKAEIKVLHEGKAFKSKTGQFIKQVFVLVKLDKFERVEIYYIDIAGPKAGSIGKFEPESEEP